MAWLWWTLLAMAPVAGGLTWWAAVTSGGALMSPVPLSVAVLLGAAAYPAWRLGRILRRVAPASEWLRCTYAQGRLTSRAEANIPSLCMEGVPADAEWVARQLLPLVVDQLRLHGGFSVDTLTANLVSPKTQQLPHRLRLLPGDPRVVTDAVTGSTTAMLASHLNACAEPLLGSRLAFPLLEQSMALYPGDPAMVATEDAPPNENNCMAWKALGDTLFELGRTEEGLARLRDAVARSPAWAAQFKAQVVAEASPTLADARVEFWRTLDVEGTRRRVLRGG